MKELRDIRQAMGLTQRELARQMRTHANVVSYAERGLAVLPAKFLQPLLEICALQELPDYPPEVVQRFYANAIEDEAAKQAAFAAELRAVFKAKGLL